MIWTQYLLALLILATATGIAFLLEQWLLPSAGTVLVLQLAVLVTALATRIWPAVLTAVGGALVFNFFFTEPRFSFHMVDVDEIITMLVFFMVALITSHLATSFRTQKKELHQAELRSNILLSLSHDLRTPLASIIGNLSTLQTYQQKLPQYEQDELLQAALDESDRLHLYIENLLQATRIQYSALQLTTSVQNVDLVLAKVIQRVGEPQRFQLDIAPALPPVDIQRSLVEQALFNIIDNAVKFSPPDSPIRITARHEQQQACVTICIKDSGPGIPTDLREKVFQLFVTSRQGDAGTGGTGLGLAVADGIIRAHQGSLTIEDTTDGCTMCIRFPVNTDLERE